MSAEATYHLPGEGVVLLIENKRKASLHFMKRALPVIRRGRRPQGVQIPRPISCPVPVHCQLSTVKSVRQNPPLTPPISLPPGNCSLAFAKQIMDFHSKIKHFALKLLQNHCFGKPAGFAPVQNHWISTQSRFHMFQNRCI